MSAEIIIGSLSVLIGADASPLARGTKDADTRLKNLERTTSNVTNRMKNLLAAVAGPAALGLLIKSSLDLIDTQSKLARQIDGTIGGVQSMTRVAQLAGVEFGALESAFHRMTRRMGEALRDPNSQAADAFRRMGLSAQQLMEMDIDERMAVIADRIKVLGLNAAQTGDFIGQLGIRGGKIAALFENGGDAIREARKELELFGVKVDKIDGEKVEMANDAMTTFGLIAQGVGNTLAVELAPAMLGIANAARKFIEEQGGMGEIISKVMSRVAYEIDETQKTFRNLEIIFNKTIGKIVDGLNYFASAWNATLGRVIGMSIDEIDNKWAATAEAMGKAPPSQSWSDWWAEQKRQSSELAAQAIKDREALSKGKGKVDNLSSQERKQYEDRLLALQASLATEDQQLRLHREKQLKDLAEFEQRGILTKQAANEMRAKIDEEFNKRTDELIFGRLEQGIMSESELLARKHAEQMALIQEFENNKTITSAEADALRLRHSEDTAIKQAQITASAYSQMADIIDSSMSAISQIMGTESEKGFGIMKAVSMATALVKGYEAAVSAYAFGSRIGGPILGAAMAGIAAAGTAAIIAKLAGVGSKSGGSPSVSSGAGGSAAASAAVADSQVNSGSGSPDNNRSLFIKGINRGELYSGDAMRELAERMIDFQKDGGKVFIS